MRVDSNRRAPLAIFCLIGTMVGFPFFFLAFAVSPLSGTLLRFVLPALPFVALLLLWFWARSSRTEGSKLAVNSLAQEAYPPGA